MLYREIQWIQDIILIKVLNSDITIVGEVLQKQNKLE